MGEQPLHSSGGSDFALSFRGLSVSLGERAVFDGFDLDISRGRITGVIGPNGCGKSTLLRVADALLAPSAGEVLLAGESLQAMDARSRARGLALLPQVHRTPSMTVRDLVACGRYARMGVFGRMRREDWEVVDEALEFMGLQALAEVNARRLSGGERQRAFVAMALAQQAGVLMLDEPTTYLDVRASLELMALVRRLVAERGITAVVVLHDLDLALRSCDELVVLAPDAGLEPTRLVAQASPEKVIAAGALERAFGVRTCVNEGTLGRSYSFFGAGAVK